MQFVSGVVNAFPVLSDSGPKWTADSSKVLHSHHHISQQIIMYDTPCPTPLVVGAYDWSDVCRQDSKMGHCPQTIRWYNKTNVGTRGFDRGCSCGIAGRGAIAPRQKVATILTGNKELALAA